MKNTERLCKHVTNYSEIKNDIDISIDVVVGMDVDKAIATNIVVDVGSVTYIYFSLNTFRYKGLLNCAGEHRGELCWESADFRAERPRPLLFVVYYFLFFLC